MSDLTLILECDWAAAPAVCVSLGDGWARAAFRIPPAADWAAFLAPAVRRARAMLAAAGAPLRPARVAVEGPDRPGSPSGLVALAGRLAEEWARALHEAALLASLAGDSGGAASPAGSSGGAAWPADAAPAVSGAAWPVFSDAALPAGGDAAPAVSVAAWPVFSDAAPAVSGAALAVSGAALAVSGAAPAVSDAASRASGGAAPRGSGTAAPRAGAGPRARDSRPQPCRDAEAMARVVRAYVAQHGAAPDFGLGRSGDREKVYNYIRSTTARQQAPDVLVEAVRLLLTGGEGRR